MTVYERIDAALKRKGKSRRWLANQLKMPPSTFQSMFDRNSNLGLDFAESIADALDVRIGYLMGLEDFDGNLWGKDASDEAYSKIAENIERHHGSKTKLNAAFDRLNEEGQKKAVERVEELTEIPKYQKSGTE